MSCCSWTFYEYILTDQFGIKAVRPYISASRHINLPNYSFANDKHNFDMNALFADNGLKRRIIYIYIYNYVHFNI